ncbi:MAG: transglycosylase SLT domain-containing protein [Gemmatimonadales bacterium]|nr:transglycosylase SLT domain-containing protein [Gemmatimonadales bacterium]
MEISGFNPNILAADTAVGKAQESRLEALADGMGKGDETPEGLAKAAQEFEGVFLNQLLKAMRATVPENELFNSKGPSKFYQQMHDAEMAKALADGNAGMGIANLIIQQFENSLSPAQEAGEGRIPPSKPAPYFSPSTSGGLRTYQEFSVTRPDAGRMIHLRRLAEAQEPAMADTLRRFEGPIALAARETDLDPGLILAVVMEESGGNPAAVSTKGALGLMQLMPGTAREVGVKDPLQPDQNIAGGARYLKKMLDRYGGQQDLALAAYNAGPGNVDKAGGKIPDFQETRKYIDRVEARYLKLTDGTELANSNR